ncbi:glutamate receptor 2.8-like [Impatiens glandulifera]|uniref:glutamate receptor 2.8-like n=1 Tax=Impatiens glandulifera TaxID=253017 RepID=UPI001FB16616|nr:glutamate receptor 2.8-like [Impatiens glandulifera]
MMKKPSGALTFCLLIIFFFLSPKMMMMGMAQNNVSVGVVLDMEEEVAQIGLSCISMALSDFYTSNPNYATRLILHTKDSKGTVLGAAAAALELLKNVEVKAIIGPFTSMQAEFVSNLGDKARVPVISFSATSPSLTSLRSPYFVRAALNDSSQVEAISALVKAFAWRQVVPIYVDNEFGASLIPFLADALEKVNTRIPYRSSIHPNATNDQIVQELYKLMTMQTRVFILHMGPSLASKFFDKVKEVGMMSAGYVWIVTSSVANQLTSLGSMEGVLGVRPHLQSDFDRIKNFTDRWIKNRQKHNPDVIHPHLNIYGLWAYDAATALAMAVEEAGVVNGRFWTISRNAEDLEAFGESRVGPGLIKSILKTKFKGLGGYFRIVDNQLESSAFEIINGEKIIGFWTRKDGIIRKLNKSTKPSSIPKENLGSIIWPGDNIQAPKGWAVTTNGKKLIIGVPVKEGFKEFEGYSKEVFEAVVAKLKYDIPREYVPFGSDGKMNGSYDDLVQQVYFGKFDAVVGDVTIRGNRSNYVDFTLPYTESGVIMIVPINDKTRKNTWMFLRPLTWELWVTSFCLFAFIGFIVWILEHRVNEEFRGPPSHQAGTIFWFSFSTMVFAHREKIVSNLGRFVVIIWCFVFLILVQSFTASLTSMLTVQKLQPKNDDINQLIKNGENFGYQKGSFVFDLLKKKKIDKSKLKPFGTEEELYELFKKGSRNGGISAALEEVAYIKLFLARHCSMFTSVGPTYKADGFGFVFPINSPLVNDISKGILSVAEEDEMMEIENKWFNKGNGDCKDSSTSLSSNSLGLDSFRGLFLIALTASFLALLVYIIIFIYEQRHFFSSSYEGSLWNKIVLLIRHFDKKDYHSYTVRKSEFGDGKREIRTPETEFNLHFHGASASTCPPSATSSPKHTYYDNESDFSFEQGSPSPNHTGK